MIAPLVIAMDGPAGSGKSSVARAVARHLDFGLLETGAGYRALGWVALRAGVDLHDHAAITRLLADLDLRFDTDPAANRVSVGQTLVTDKLGRLNVATAASAVAQVPAVRTALNDYFRALIANESRPGIVVEGRDITTVVAPDAPVRILLTASLAARAARRAQDAGAAAAAVAVHHAARDRSDARMVDFQSAAPGVVTVDSTDLDFADTVDAVLALVTAARRRSAADPE